MDSQTQSPALPAAPIAELRGLHLPDPVGIWPPAPGWWLLAALIVLAGYLVVRQLRHYQRLNLYRKEALRAIDVAHSDYQKMLSDNINNVRQISNIKQEYFQALCVILKRTALTAYPSTPTINLAGLTGEQWVRFLFGSCPALGKSTKQPLLTPEQINTIYGELYSATPLQLDQVNDIAFRDFCRLWINKHLRNAPVDLTLSTGKTAETNPC